MRIPASAASDRQPNRREKDARRRAAVRVAAEPRYEVKPLIVPVRGSPLDSDVLTLHVSEVAESLLECLKAGSMEGEWDRRQIRDSRLPWRGLRQGRLGRSQWTDNHREGCDQRRASEQRSSESHEGLGKEKRLSARTAGSTADE